MKFLAEILYGPDVIAFNMSLGLPLNISSFLLPIEIQNCLNWINNLFINHLHAIDCLWPAG